MRASIEDITPVPRAAQHVVAFTGAGMSAESGIPTFRDDDGFWQRFPIDDFANWNGIVRTVWRKPRAMAEFVYEVIQPIAVAEPNTGHRALEQLERRTRVTVVTQNIDGLHQAAGNTTVHEIHGSLFELVSLKGQFQSLIDRRRLQKIAKNVDRARRGPLTLVRLIFAIRPWLGLGLRGIHRPNLVLFGDSMAEPAWSMSQTAANECDCMIQVGCSGVVYPAAMLPMEAREAGATTIAIGPQPTEADFWLPGTAASVLPELVAAL